MSTDKTLEVQSQSLDDTLKVGEKLGQLIKPGDVIELVGDIGAGKTVLVRGLAKGAGSSDAVASPSFTICRVYKTDAFDIHHFDFYRLNDPGIVKSEIAEVLADQAAVVVVEWSNIIADILPESRYIIEITSQSEESRTIKITLPETAE